MLFYCSPRWRVRLWSEPHPQLETRKFFLVCLLRRAIFYYTLSLSCLPRRNRNRVERENKSGLRELGKFIRVDEKKRHDRNVSGIGPLWSGGWRTPLRPFAELVPKSARLQSPVRTPSLTFRLSPFMLTGSLQALSLWWVVLGFLFFWCSVFRFSPLAHRWYTPLHASYVFPGTGRDGRSLLGPTCRGGISFSRLSLFL